MIVDPVDQSVTERESGLVTIENYAPDVMGTIIAAGTVLDVKVGDVVLFPPDAGQRLDYQDRTFLVLQEDELIATVE